MIHLIQSVNDMPKPMLIDNAVVNRYIVIIQHS
jgi:hypothetical protein